MPDRFSRSKISDPVLAKIQADIAAGKTPAQTDLDILTTTLAQVAPIIKQAQAAKVASRTAAKAKVITPATAPAN